MKYSDLSRRNFIPAVTTTTVITAFLNVIPAFGSSSRNTGKFAILSGMSVRNSGS